MANVDASDLTRQPRFAGGFGNADVLHTQMTPGVTVQIADVIRPMLIPKNTRMEDLQLVTVGANAGATISVGYAAVDGSDVDATYFIPAATSIAASSRLRATAAKAPKALPVDAYLTITVAGATVAAGTVIAATLRGKYLGEP